MRILCPLFSVPPAWPFGRRLWILARLTTLSTILVLGSVAVASAANTTAVDSRDGKTRIDLVGEILPGDADTLKSLIRRANEAGEVVVTIRLNFPWRQLA